MATVGDVVAAVEVFREMSQSKMSVTIGVRVADAIDELNKVLEVFDEQRKRIVADESLSDDEKLEQINALLAEPIDVSTKLRLSDVELIGIQMEPAIARAVAGILEGDSGEEPA